MVWLSPAHLVSHRWQEEHLNHSQTEGYEKLSENRNAESLAASLLHQGGTQLPALYPRGSPERTASPWQKRSFAATRPMSSTIRCPRLPV